MKLTKQQLKQIIEEEITQAIAEADELPEGWSGPDQSPLNLPPLPDAPAGPQQAYFLNIPGNLTYAVEAPGDEKARVWRYVHKGAGNTPAREWVLIYPSEQRDAESSGWRRWAAAAEKDAERVKKKLHAWLKEQDVAPEGGPGFEDAPWEEGKKEVAPSDTGESEGDDDDWSWGIDPKVYHKRRREASDRWEKKKMKIAKEQLHQIIKEELGLKKELSVEEDRLLRESLWGKIKHFVAKHGGSMEKGGKIFGRGERSAKAVAQYQDILGKESNKLIKDMMDAIKKEAPEFPNDEKPEVFTSALTDFYILYDSLVASAKKWRVGVPAKEQEEGAMDPVSANEIIRDLRSVVKKLSDYELADTFKHALEEGAEEERLDELFGLGDRGWKKQAAQWEKEDQEGEKRATDDGSEEGEPEEKGVLDPDSGLDTFKGLESMKLPAILGILGASMGALGWMAKTKWFASLIGDFLKEGGYKYITDPEMGAEAITKAFEDRVRPGEGVLRVVERLSGTDLTGTGATKADLLRAMQSGGLPPEGLAQLGQEGSQKFIDAWKERVLNVPDNTPLSKIFTPGEFSGKTGVFGLHPGPFKGLLVTGLKQVVKKAGKTVASTGFTAAGGAGAALGGAASVLPILGIGAASAGAAIAALRKKSTSDYGSRARLLNDLYNELKPVEVPQQLEPIVPPREEEEGEGEEGEQGDKERAEELINQFKKGDYVMYTEVDPKGGERDISVARITALPGEVALEESESHTTDIIEEDTVPSLETQFADTTYNRWDDPENKDRWGNNKKIFAQLEIIAVKSKDREELSRMAKRPVNAAPVFRDEGDGFKSYITKISDVNPGDYDFEEYTVVRKPKEDVVVDDEDAISKKVLGMLGIDFSVPGEGGAEKSVKRASRGAKLDTARNPMGISETEALNEQKVLDRWRTLAKIG